jgi:hypothetical protein
MNDSVLFNLHRNELARLVEVHDKEWSGQPDNPIRLQRVGTNNLAKIGAVSYAYDGKEWVRL